MTSNFKIRKASQEDIPQIVQLFYIAIAEQDELIDNNKLKNLLFPVINKNPRVSVEYIPHAKHILILKDMHLYINKFINRKR